MEETRTFPLDEMLSVTTGCLVARRKMDAMYDLMGYVLADPGITTIGLAAMLKTAKAELLRQHPQLADVAFTAHFEAESDEEAWPQIDAWLAPLVAKHGNAFEVRPIPESIPRSLADDIEYIGKVNPNATVIAVDA